MATTWKVAVSGDEVTAVLDDEGSPGAPVFVFAHGAGGNLADRGVLASADVLRQCGLRTVRFNFVYRERRLGRPDPMPLLMACVAAVAERVRAELNPGQLIIGGRSMGGRAASMLAAQGYRADGLLLLAYPLHPPRKQEQLRSAHLPDVVIPVLCVNGTRDEFCNRDLMERVLTTVRPTWRMHWIEGADHSFHVLKSSGRRDPDVMREIGEATGAWMRESVTGDW